LSIIYQSKHSRSALRVQTDSKIASAIFSCYKTAILSVTSKPPLFQELYRINVSMFYSKISAVLIFTHSINCLSASPCTNCTEVILLTHLNFAISSMPPALDPAISVESQSFISNALVEIR